MLRKPLFVFLITRIPLFLLSFLALKILPLNSEYSYYSAFPAYLSQNKFIEGFTRWDASWYVDVAKNGYSFSPGGMSNIAFFPLYPLFIRFLTLVIPDPYIAGIILANIAFLTALIIIFYLVKIKLNEKVAYRTILFISVFPFSFFFSSVYTESFFLLASSLVFLLLEKKEWLWAAVTVSIASLTRTQGSFLIPVLILHMLSGSGFTFKKIKFIALISIIISSLGIITFITFNKIEFNEPFAFLIAHTQGWLRYFDFTFPEHRRIVGMLFGLEPVKYPVFDLLKIFNLILTIIWLSLIPKIQKLLGLSYSVFTALVVGIPFINSLWSLERFILVAFPGFIVLANLKQKDIFRGILILSTLFLGFWATLFFTGYPIQ